jgi:3-deoxy-7-phosphoheptulonate synthase
VQPALLRHEIVSPANCQKTVAVTRFATARIVAGQDDRIMVVVGPCSIHSPDQALEYAHLLKSKIPAWGNLLIVMRAYLYVHLTSRFRRLYQHLVAAKYQPFVRPLVIS